MQENQNVNEAQQNNSYYQTNEGVFVTEWVNATSQASDQLYRLWKQNTYGSDCVSTRCVRLTVLQAHPQLFVVFLLHVVDDLALVFEGIGLFDAGHEVSLDHRAGRTVEQVTIWKILIHAQAFSLRTAALYLPIKGQRNVNSYLFSLYLKAIRITNCPKSCKSFI